MSRNDFIENDRIKECNRIIESKNRSGKVLRMKKSNSKLSLEEVLSFNPNEHQYCYSNLHW